MNKFLTHILTSVITGVIQSYRKTSLELIKIELVKEILLNADRTRGFIAFLITTMAAIVVMAFGFVLLIAGLVSGAALFYFGDVPIWIPAVLLVTGFICFVTVWHKIYNISLDEGTWLRMIKENKYVGPMVAEVLSKIEQEQEQKPKQ